MRVPLSCQYLRAGHRRRQGCHAGVGLLFDGYGGNKDAAKAVGLAIAKKAVEAGITEVVFDRGGYVYGGRIQQLAEGAREGGLKF